MNYTVFEQMREAAFSKKQGETDQQYMERVLQAVFQTEESEESSGINSMLCGTFTGCDVQKRSLAVGFHGEKWMCNPNGSIHGGVMTTAADMTMGLLARFYRQVRGMVTTNLSISFMRPIPAGGWFTVRATVDKAGARMIFMRADILLGDTDEIAASAQASFM